MRMKIVYLVHQFYPELYTGTEKFVLNLSRMVQKAGNRVKVITYSFYENSFYDQRRGEILCKEFLYKGIPVLAIKHKQLPDDLHHAIGNAALAEIAGDLINVEQADIFHIGHTMRVGALTQALQPLGIPYILTVTDFFLACPKVNLMPSRQPLCSGPERGEACGRLCPELQSDYIHKRLESAKSILFNARSVIAPSAFVARVFNGEFPGLDVKVTHHGLSFERLKRNQKTYANGDRVVFCYAGSFNPHKGVHLLIEAFKTISSGNALLKIYGSGPDKPYVDNLMAMAGGNKNIEFCGLYSEDKTGEILNSVDVVIIPSLCYESYSMILHEALACNVPVVATELGGLAEKIQDGVNGFLFNMGDSKHLQTVLQKIVKEPVVLNPLKRNISSMMIQGIEEEAYTYVKAYRLVNDRPSLARRSGKRLSDWAAFLTKRFDVIAQARGYFEQLNHGESGLLVKGWMLLPESELTSIEVYFNGKLVGQANLEVRQDVASAIPDIPHAAKSGVRFFAAKASEESMQVGQVYLIGCQDGRPVARMSSLCWADLDNAVPTPPPELMKRVLGTLDAQFFKIAGLKSFGEFLDAALRHRNISSIRRFLDWGCGCGRVCVHFLSAPDGPEVFGCDVDSEAIAWCRENLRPGHFSMIQPWPPTSYKDAMFDLVIGFSVFTHLSREAQEAWLAEMRRIIAPGGLLLASTHGESAASFVPGVSVEVVQHGIFDKILDPVLNGIAPEGYYRGTFQTREYTLREWSKYFEILDYIDRGTSNHQDLVVMRRPD
jgi:glycosyltransferase involved in cell wall biosynthesis/SAM-dependent methyltransferase